VRLRRVNLHPNRYPCCCYLLFSFLSLSLSFPLSPLLKLIWRARARAPSAKSVQKTSRSKKIYLLKSLFRFFRSLLFPFGFLLFSLLLFFDFVFLSQIEHELQSVHVDQSLRYRRSVAPVRSQSLHRPVQEFVHDTSR